MRTFAGNWAVVLAAISFLQVISSADQDWGISTIAGTGQAGFSGDGGSAISAQINNPYGVVLGPDGALYICEIGNHRVRRVDREGRISTIAGNGKQGYSGDGGSALEAELNEPYEARFDGTGNLFFVEMKNHLVRQVSTDGKIRTIAGTGRAGFSGDGGSALQAQLSQPHSIQLDGKGSLFICDIGNHRIRKVDLSSGGITTFAGTGRRGKTDDGGRIAEVDLNGPRAIDFDGAGDMWVALREGNAIYRINMKAGTIHHVAGTGAKGFTGNGGPAAKAALSGPKGISAGKDRIYFADTESHSIRYIDLQRHTVELLAGTGSAGDGPENDPLSCQMARPHGVFAGRDGAVYIGDSENHRVRVVKPKN